MQTVLADFVNPAVFQLHRVAEGTNATLVLYDCPNTVKIPLTGVICKRRFTTTINLLCDGTGYGKLVSDIGEHHAELYVPNDSGTLVGTYTINIQLIPEKAY